MSWANNKQSRRIMIIIPYPPKKKKPPAGHLNYFLPVNTGCCLKTICSDIMPKPTDAKLKFGGLTDISRNNKRDGKLEASRCIVASLDRRQVKLV